MKIYKLNGQRKDLKNKRKFNRDKKEVLRNNPCALVINYKDGTKEVIGCNPYATIKFNIPSL